MPPLVSSAGDWDPTNSVLHSQEVLLRMKYVELLSQMDAVNTLNVGTQLHDFIDLSSVSSSTLSRLLPHPPYSGSPGPCGQPEPRQHQQEPVPLLLSIAQKPNPAESCFSFPTGSSAGTRARTPVPALPLSRSTAVHLSCLSLL